MVVFTFLIAFCLALAVLAGGLVLLGAQKGPWAKTAGFILAIGGGLALACAGYHGLKYYFVGGFNGPFPGARASMSAGQGMMGSGGMMPMMDTQGMGNMPMMNGTGGPGPRGMSSGKMGGTDHKNMGMDGDDADPASGAHHH
ncbi:MAG TPA: hypothetical protein VFR02_08265 [bacterium]|nr:hypothetical protein [bacterium]